MWIVIEVAEKDLSENHFIPATLNRSILYFLGVHPSSLESDKV